MPSLDPMDPAYVMSMPSNDPADILGYTQKHRAAVQQPLSALGWNPYYEVTPPVERDILNKGDRTNVHGYTLPEGYTWSMYGDEPAGQMMNREISNIGAFDPVREMKLAESDQTTYIGSRARKTSMETPMHESVHRGIGKVWGDVYGGRISSDENELLTRIWDFQNANYGKMDLRQTAKKHEQLKYYIRREAYKLQNPKNKGGKNDLLPLDKALDIYGGKLNKLSERAAELRNVKMDEPDMDLVWLQNKPNPPWMKTGKVKF